MLLIIWILYHSTAISIFVYTNDSCENRRFVENKNEMMKIFPPYSTRTQGSTPLPKVEDLDVDPEAEINQYHETKLYDVL
jgi:hypothetical protein